MKMRITAVLMAGLLFITVFMNFVPGGQSQEESTEWFDELLFEGSCSSGNVPHRFWVNSTVVELDINISWPQGDGSDLNFWITNSTLDNVEASYSSENPEIMNIRTITGRGRWTLWLVPKSCGSSGQVNYTLRISLHHIALPDIVLSINEINEGENITLNLTKIHENTTHYFIDYNDGTNSGWSLNRTYIKTYKDSGNYTPRVKVRYKDGIESDWVDDGSIEVRAIEVAAEPEGPNMFFWVGFWLLLIGGLSFGLNLLIGKRKGI